MKEKLEEFFRKRPNMLKKYRYPGTFDDFAEDLKNSVAPQKNGHFIKKTIMEKVERIFPNEISLKALEDQLSKAPVLSTADHHGILNYKLLYNSNLLYSEIIKKLKLPFVIVSASGSVPLDNISHPRGFYFKKQKFNFYGGKESKTPIFLFEKKLCADKKKGINSFITSYAEDALTTEEKRFLEYLFFESLEIEKVSQNYKVFSDQVTFLNYKLWKYYFDKSIRESTPEMIYLQSNQIILNILINMIEDKNALVSLILFDPEVRRIFLKNFEGIPGCWGESMGSQLFWAVVDKKKYKRFIRLSLDDASNSLIGDNFQIELERETILDALKTKKIIATIFFDYLILSFIDGYMMLGGFNQLDYLPQMQEAHIISMIDYMIEMQQAHIKSLKEIGMNDLAEEFASRVTDGLICGMFPFDFDSGIDLIWHYNSRDGKFNGNLDRGLTQEDLDRMNNMKVKDMIGAAVETMLGIV